MGQIARTTGRGYTLGTGALPCPVGQSSLVVPGRPAVWPADRSEPPQNLSLTALSESASTRLRLRNYGGRLIRIHAFHVARVNRRDHVVVGCSARDRGIGKIHHRNQRGIQLRRVRSVRRCATIYVVAAHCGRACSPGHCHRVGSDRHARARNRDC